MTKTEKEITISTYFNMWIERDFSKLDTLFSTDIYYSECYGPEYFCLSEIYLWIDDMLKKQIVREWKIKRYIHTNDITVVEWFFTEQQGDTVHSFDGVSIITFNSIKKISSIKEFESKAEHIAPYH